MIKRLLSNVQEMVNGTGLSSEVGSVEIYGVTIDSRNVQKGNLFIPIVGDNFNGHGFIGKAIAQGAVATLWAKGEPNAPTNIPVIYVEDTLLALQTLAKSYRHQLSLKVVGVTGSNGKTSTKDILYSMLSVKYKVHKTQGNFNNHIGLPLTILQLKEDTEVAILEMGMSGFGEIELLSEIATPDAGIITNIGESHLMDLGSRDGIAQAKLEITAGMKADGILVYHGDEPLLINRLENESCSFEKITFGENNKSDYYPTTIELQEDGTSFSVNKAEGVTYFLPVPGKHNVFNTLSAMAVGQHFGLTWDEMNKGLASLQMTKMRMETIKTASGLTIINDAYNASPTSMKAALEFISGLEGFANKIVVLGDMLELGNDEIAFHEEVGKAILPEQIDYVFTFGTLGKHISIGARACSHVEAYCDKEELIKALQAVVTSKDIVLVKASRGMKLEEVIEALK